MSEEITEEQTKQLTELLSELTHSTNEMIKNNEIGSHFGMDEEMVKSLIFGITDSALQALVDENGAVDTEELSLLVLAGMVIGKKLGSEHGN